MNKETKILSLSIQDLLSAKMLKYSLLPFLLSILVIFSALFLFTGYGIDSLTHIGEESSFMQNSVVQWLMSHTITSWILSSIMSVFNIFLALYLSIFISLIILGFLTPVILKVVQERHYENVEMKSHANLFESLFLTLKWFCTMIVMFIILIPLYFIPLVNIVAFNLPSYYFFHKMLSFDICTNICTREESKEIQKSFALSTRLKTLAMYFLSLIPFVVFFVSVFFVIYLGHSYFLRAKELRESYKYKVNNENKRA